MDCVKCGKRLLKDNTTGACQRTKECQAEYRRRKYILEHGPSECIECGGPIQRRNRYGVCAKTERCNALRTQLHRAYRKRTGMNRAYALRQLYGLSTDEYDALYEAQGRRCAICRRATGATRRLCVDHDHALEGKRDSIRGLLCNACNRMLGRGRDDAAMFQRAVDYLNDPPAPHVLNKLRGQ